MQQVGALDRAAITLCHAEAGNVFDRLLTRQFARWDGGKNGCLSHYLVQEGNYVRALTVSPVKLFNIDLN